MIRLYFIVGILLILTGCADKVDVFTATTMEPVGFWYGYWHGFIVVWSFIGSLFIDDIAIYATYNSGSWYDFGFVCAIITLILGYEANSD